MPIAQDRLIAQYQTELEERQSFIDHLLEQSQGRDLDPHESELMTRASDRMAVLNTMIDPLQASAKISAQSRQRMEELASQIAQTRNPVSSVATMEYRSAGQYVVDKWQAGVGMQDARDRLELWHRAAAHQTTGDNLGVIPDPIIGPVLNYIDAVRPIVSMLGPMDVPSGRFSLPKITQHTSVDQQTAEKGELASQKMTITTTAVAMETYGGYLNVSRQNIDWSVPQIMDIVLNDLAAQYAIKTESVTAVDLTAGATAQTPVISSGSTAAEVNAAVWKAVGATYTAMKGVGRSFIAVAPDLMGVFGGLFPTVNPQNGFSTGFTAADFAQGQQGAVSGIPVVMSAGLAAGKALMINTAAASVFEQRIGALSVTEPSVLGVQVAYAGYFQDVIVNAAGVIKLTA